MGAVCYLGGDGGVTRAVLGVSVTDIKVVCMHVSIGRTCCFLAPCALFSSSYKTLVVYSSTIVVQLAMFCNPRTFYSC